MVDHTPRGTMLARESILLLQDTVPMVNAALAKSHDEPNGVQTQCCFHLGIAHILYFTK